MNISALTIYLWQLADKLNDTLIVLSIISGIIAFIGLVFFIAVRIESMKECYVQSYKAAGWSIGVFVVCLCAKTLIPSSNTIAMMVVVPKITNSKVVQQDIPDLYNAAVEALKSSLKKE